METVMLSVRVDKELADRIAKIAADHDRSVSAELRRAIRAHVNENGEARPVMPSSPRHRR